jgi:hypothetical protein
VSTNTRPGCRSARALLLPTLLVVLLASPPATSLLAAASVAGHQWGLTGLGLWRIPPDSASVQLLRDLGVTHVRAGPRWSTVQPSGPDQWDWARADAEFSACRTAGLRTWLVVASGSAPWATDRSGLTPDNEATADCPPLILPRLDEPITGAEPFYRFAHALVARYGDDVDVWLLDNEASEPWSWAGDSYSYACLVRLAATAIRDADPGAAIALGAIPASTVSAMVIADRLDDPSQEEFVVSYASRMWGYPLTIEQIRAVFEAPQLRVWDRVNFYRQALSLLPLVDVVAGNVLSGRARGALAQDLVWSYQDQMLAHGGGTRPLLFTEMNPYLSDATTLAQESTTLMIASLASGGVVGQAYLGFMDDGPGAEVPSSGLVTETLQPKAGYYAYRTLISQLGDAASADPLDIPSPATGYRFTLASGATTYVLWSPVRASANLSSLVGTKTALLVRMTGEAVLVASRRVPIGPSPVYVSASAGRTRTAPSLRPR